MSNANSSISAILVESDGSITLAGSGGIVFLNADGTLNTGRGDGDGSGGRTGYVVDANIGFVTGLTDAGSYYFDAFMYWGVEYGGGSGFIITTMGDGSDFYLTSVDFNGQFNAGFGDGAGALVEDASGYWSGQHTVVGNIYVDPYDGPVGPPMIATAVFNGSTWSLDTYTLDGISHQSLSTVLATFSGLVEKSDGTLVMVGYDSGGDGELLTFGYDAGTADGTGIYYYCTLASETALPGESDGGVFLSQIVLDASGQVINAGGYDNTIWGFNPTATATRVWVQQDANWNVTSIEDSSGAVLERYVTDPYGQFAVTDAAGTVKVGGSDYNWVYNFEGKRGDSVSNTIDFNHRIYFLLLDRFGQLDPAGFVNGPNRYQPFVSNPVNKLDPTGLVVPSPAVKPPPPKSYRYKALPGARFRGAISSPAASGPGYVGVSVDFLVPNNWVGPARIAAPCSEIKIIQIITYEQEDGGGFQHHSERSWEIDNQLSGAARSKDEFYVGSSSWWDVKSPIGVAWIMDEPGEATGFFRSYYLRMDFRDYAVAIGGADNGVSYGYFDWGFEWANPPYGGDTQEHIWMGSGSAYGTMGAALSYRAPEQAPKPGGVEVRLPNKASAI